LEAKKMKGVGVCQQLLEGTVNLFDGSLVHINEMRRRKKNAAEKGHLHSM
jgi:hypothetical protein